MTKKLLAIASVVAVFFCFGCEKKSADNTVFPDISPESTIENKEALSEADEFPSEPPQMEVIFGEKTICAMRGSYSWRVDGDDGKSQYTIADGIHPLTAKEHMPCLSLNPSNSNDSYTAQLVFKVAPKKVTAETWPIKAFRNQSITSEKASVDTIEIDYADGRNACDYTLQLKNGEYIYHVTAEWERRGEFGGSAEYCFYTECDVTGIRAIENENEKCVILCGYPLKEEFE